MNGDAIAIRATILHAVGQTRDALDAHEALSGERPPASTLEHVARMQHELGALAHAARTGDECREFALALAADALGLLEWISEKERAA